MKPRLIGGHKCAGFLSASYRSGRAETKRYELQGFNKFTIQDKMKCVVPKLTVSVLMH